MRAPPAHVNMPSMGSESLILAVVSSPQDAVEVMNKAAALGRRVDARVDVLDLHAPACFQGDQADAILRRVESSCPVLVLRTPAGSAGLRRFTAHDSDWEFATRCPAPVLLVRGRTWQDPPKFGVPVDVADEEEEPLVPGILRAANRLAIGTEAQVDVLYSERETNDEAVRMRRAVRLAQLVRQTHVGGARIEMFAGEPVKRLPPLVAARRYDVLVLGGAPRREGIVQRMPVKLARLLEATDGDALLVGRPGGATQPSPDSALQQRPHQAEQLA